jgi:MFS family permease
MKSVFSIVGAGLATWPNDRFGRKPMILSIQIAFIGACLLEMFATKPNHWLGARILDVSSKDQTKQWWIG